MVVDYRGLSITILKMQDFCSPKPGTLTSRLVQIDEHEINRHSPSPKQNLAIPTQSPNKSAGNSPPNC
jgi:hypothetical protein